MAAEVRATVRMEGPRPAPEPLSFDDAKSRKALKECGSAARVSQRLVVDQATGGVQDAAVWLEAVTVASPTAGDTSSSTRTGSTRSVGTPAVSDTPSPAGTGPARSPVARQAEPQAVVLDQRDCLFVPHVLMAPVGGRVALHNADVVVHNVRVFEDATRQWEQWQQPHAADLAFPLDGPGRYLVRCGVHPWMYAWVLITDAQHFGVTGPAGEVIIPSVPDGTYTVHVWHETLGETQQRLSVTAQSARVTITMSHNTKDEP